MEIQIPSNVIFFVNFIFLILSAALGIFFKENFDKLKKQLDEIKKEIDFENLPNIVKRTYSENRKEIRNLVLLNVLKERKNIKVEERMLYIIPTINTHSFLMNLVLWSDPNRLLIWASLAISLQTIGVAYTIWRLRKFKTISLLFN